MSLNEHNCKMYITEPNGMKLSVARAVNGGDFQARYVCKECKNPCDDDGEGY